MHLTVPVFSIFGTQVRVHFTIFFLFPVLFFHKELIIPISLLFSSIVLHEFGHVLVARFYKIYTPFVILLPIGGLAMIRSDKKEFLITIAGPAVNLGLFLLFALLSKMFSSNHIFLLIQEINIILFIFNLIPAYPLDGGRILSCFCPKKLCNIISKFIAIIFICMAFYLKSPSIFFIGVFILLACNIENNERERIGFEP